MESSSAYLFGVQIMKVLVDKQISHDERLLAGSKDDFDEPLSIAERAASWEAWYELRREADIDFVEMMR